MKKLLLGGAAALLAWNAARAELAISANDNKVVLENGTLVTVPNPRPDTITILDLAANPPRVRAELPVPTSVVGPPLSVAISPDARLALVTANQAHDPADPTKFVNGTGMAVIDLAANPPRVAATVATGAAPAGVDINRAGTLALVANRGDGSVGVYRIAGGQVTQVGNVVVGNAASLVSMAVFTPDGRHALVSRYGDATVTVLDVNGETVTKSNRDLTTGVNPYGLAITRDGRWAVVANIGRSTGDADTVSLIDLQRPPFRVVDTISVGQTPEGIQVSPDGTHVAVTVMNGSNKAANSPFVGPGLVKLLRIDNGRLRIVAEARVGAWAQGAAFSHDGRSLLVGNMVDRNISVLRVAGDRLTDTGTRIAVSGGSAALVTAPLAPARNAVAGR